MEVALQQAQIAQENNEVPVGAVIVQNNKIVAKAGNQTIGDCDPTGHAEIVVMRKAAKILGNERLDDCDLYVTLEPCAMCAGAIAHARIRRLYYAAKDEKGGAVENGVKFFGNQTCQHKPQIYEGFKQEEAEMLLKNFFEKRR